MYNMPASLQDTCIECICDNIERLCDVQNTPTEPRLVFKEADVYFHNNLSDQLLARLNEKGRLKDDTLSLFNGQNTTLRRVNISSAPVTVKGITVMKEHKISELRASGMNYVNINNIISCLSDWSLTNLRLLDVGKSSFIFSKYGLILYLSRLKGLQHLNVSSTKFNRHDLELITQQLPLLEKLDISCTLVNNITALKRCKTRLRVLKMYKLGAVNNPDFAAVLMELSKLRCLDVSDDATVTPLAEPEGKGTFAEILARTPPCFPHIDYLDISGTDGVSEAQLSCFLENHPNVKFIGLALTELCFMTMFTEESSTDFRKNLQVTGDATERQIVEALKKYSDRGLFVQKSLYNLFSLTHGISQARADLIDVILPGMKNHSRELGVQMAATACLYNLTKADFGVKTHPSCLRRVVELTLDAMENFPNHQQLQKNTLLTLCSDRILQEVIFDRFRCARLVMECLCSFDDPSMSRMAVAICSILAAKIPTEQTSQLGTKLRYMQKLLSIVKEKAESQVVDITMKFSLSALWNLTDESPATCSIFISEGGLELFMQVLESYVSAADDKRIQIETKVLGLLNNIAEVPDLRERLLNDECIEAHRRLLASKHIDVSYFAAGIVSHLISVEPLWLGRQALRKELLLELGQAVGCWSQPNNEMVAYRSFHPFFPLLQCGSPSEVQLWAVWAIHHVCSKNASRYCPMLKEEGGSSLIRALLRSADTDQRVVLIARQIMDLAKENY
ncbi:protein zyg-11 homolog B [Lingula anatina]|uniref:Protein zyg-11 homolog B n=1 Tax=Lingula anatina TaxID=7574 RepID=A0A1S3JBW1_LINAN|nr:protein zyg-11 homolog B [Lingula anatina]|eukprot:XP_013407895.1 protein zyg-11 homolog B [Lingula anatina]